MFSFEMTKMLRLFLLVLALSSPMFHPGDGRSNIMEKHVLNNREATCNDGTRAVYYLGFQAPTKWLIFLESGAYCSSQAHCQARFVSKKTKALMTSKNMPNRIEGRDLLSTVRKENPTFYDFSHVLIPYCSSDIWLGTNKVPVASNNRSKHHFVFSGKTIFRSVIFDLLNGNFTLAREVVLVGSSAGATGVMNNIEILFKQAVVSLGKDTKVSVIIDGGWFTNFRESMSSKLNGEFDNVGLSSPACADYSFGFPCCLSASCMLTRGFYPSDVPTLFVFSLYDFYVVADVLLRMTQTANVVQNSASDLLTLVAMYGGAMNQSLIDIQRLQANVSYFVPACLQHTFFSMSSLRDPGQLLHYTRVVTKGNAMMNFSKQSGTWRSVTIPVGTKHISLTSAVSKWFTSRDKPVRMIDSCIGVLCNPTCPDKLTFVDSAKDWGEVLNGIVLFVSLLPTVVCVVLKIAFMVQFILLRRAQKRYVEEPGSSQIPVYRSVEAINIAYVSTNIPDEIHSHENPKTESQENDVLHDRVRLSIDQDRMVGTSDINAALCFNGGDFVAVVSESGAGKTTFLDLLSGRLMSEHHQEHLFINGVNLARIQDWYTTNVGYVSSSFAELYYRGLTVRQYLFLGAQMRLPRDLNNQEKLDRVEEIISQLNLTSVADTRLNGSVKENITTVQVRLLGVALQLITRPLAVFLDEPVAGLDYVSSLEMLNTLKRLCDKNVLVVVTLQTPPEEMIQRFDQVVIIFEKQVIYSSTPSQLSADFDSVQGDRSNVNKRFSDMISDIVNSEKIRQAMMSLFQTEKQFHETLKEIDIFRQRSKDLSLASCSSARKAGIFNRLFVMDSLVSMSLSTGETFYLPILFTLFGFTAGVVFWQAEELVPIMTSYSGSSIPSLLFLSFVLISCIKKSLEVSGLDPPNSVCLSYEVVIQTFVSASAFSVLPVVTCSVMSYMMVMTAYDWWRLSLVTGILLVLNQTWTATYMLLILANPKYARYATLIAAIMGSFATGFIVPQDQMPMGYNLLFYVNPQFYGFSAIVKVLLRNVRVRCEYESALNCISTDGNAVLSRFDFDSVNPFQQLVILLSITSLSLLFSWFLAEARTRRRHFYKSCFKTGRAN